MNNFINFILTILFFGFATRQMMLFNDIIGALFLFFIGLLLALYNDN